VTPEEIHAAVGRALVAAVDARTVGRDLGQAAALASIARRGAKLGLKEARAGHRILTRHIAELNQAGIDLPPEPPEPVAAPRLAAAGQPEVRGIKPGQEPTGRIRSDGKIGVRSPYALREVMKAIPGGVPRKDGANWEWVYAASPAAAAAVVEALSPFGGRFSPKVIALAEDHGRRVEAGALLVDGSPLPEIDIHPLIKPGFHLWEHQIRAVAFAGESTASLLAIPMGGGKTLATIAAINREAIKRPQRVVITCPNKVRGVWPREVRKFSKLDWHIVNGTRPSKRARSGYVSLSLPQRLAQLEECLFDCTCGAPVHAAVVNYESFNHDPWNDWTPPKRIDVLVQDEIHRIKSYRLKTQKGMRTMSGALAQWVNFTGKRIGLTGTPLPQTPLDAYGIFRALDPGIFGGSWTSFKNRYSVANPHLPEMIVGYKNIAELAAKFFSVTYRPEIDLKLPGVTDITYEFDLEPKARAAYKSIDEDLWADLSVFTGKQTVSENWDELHDRLAELLESGAETEEIQAVLEKLDATGGGGGRDTSTVTPANVMVRLLRLQQLTGGTVIDDDGERVRVSTGKAELLAEVLEEVGCTPATDTHEPEPVIVFCRFRSDLDAVREIATKAKLRYAEVSGRRHDGLSADAEMNPDADIVAVQIQSGGTGVDFTRARIMIWYSLGYSMSDYDQARKRLDRPGQKRPVLSIHLLASDTADMDVYTALDGRRAVVESVMRAHGVDPARMGFRNETIAEEGEGKWVSGQGAVALPFDSLIERERVRMGVPTQKVST
jgi:superfamily II DNA or RNA helicase